MRFIRLSRHLLEFRMFPTFNCFRNTIQYTVHEEVGYWLWDPKEKQVLRCFIVPRGIAVIAGGTTDPTAQTFALSADVSSETYGICSNQFLDREFKTVRYELKVIIHDPNSFTYEEDTQIRIKGNGEIFHHRDKNTLKRVKSF